VALIDVRCTEGHVHEVYRPAADWPKTPTCPSCGGVTVQVHLPPSARARPDPVVVYQAPDGSLRYPGDSDGLSCAKYDRLGYQRVELRGAADVRRFEKHVNQREYSDMCRRVERQQAVREQSEAERRSLLRAKMQSMSRHGRDLAREVMRRNDNKPKTYAKEPGFYSEVYSVDRTNREPSRDSRGHRRHD
jgi:hypothetical protein